LSYRGTVNPQSRCPIIENGGN